MLHAALLEVVQLPAQVLDMYQCCSRDWPGGKMKVALQGHLVGRQVEVLLVLDDFPDLAHAQRQRVPWQLVLTDANETVIPCTRTVVLGQADEHWERRACAQGAQGLAQGGE